jgi:hypothetical protein
VQTLLQQSWVQSQHPLTQRTLRGTDVAVWNKVHTKKILKNTPFILCEPFSYDSLPGKRAYVFSVAKSKGFTPPPLPPPCAAVALSLPMFEVPVCIESGCIGGGGGGSPKLGKSSVSLDKTQLGPHPH